MRVAVLVQALLLSTAWMPVSALEVLTPAQVLVTVDETAERDAVFQLGKGGSASVRRGTGETIPFNVRVTDADTRRLSLESGASGNCYAVVDGATRRGELCFSLDGVRLLGTGAWSGYQLRYSLQPAVGQPGPLSLRISTAFDRAAVRTMVNTPYGSRRGPSEETVRPFQQALNNKGLHSYGEPYVLLRGERYGHLIYDQEPSLRRVAVSGKAVGYEVVSDVVLHADNSFRSAEVHVFSAQEPEVDDYLVLSQYVKRLHRSKVGIDDPLLRPIAGASIGSQIHPVRGYRKLADKVLPHARDMGFRRLWIGQNPTKGQQYNFEYQNKAGAYDELRYYARKARDYDVELVMWVETSTTARDSALGKSRPEWLLRDADGKFLSYANQKDTLRLASSGRYIAWLTGSIEEVAEQTGIKGFWLDSFDLAWRNPGARDDVLYAPGYANLLEMIRTLQSRGVVLYGEALTPYVISSFWVRKQQYESYAGKEYLLLGSSPYTNRPDSDFVDYFKAASYLAFPVVDIHPFVDRAQVYDRQEVFYKRIVGTNQVVNELFGKHFSGMPQVRKFDSGVYWADAQGFAFFVHEDIPQLRINIPSRFLRQVWNINGRPSLFYQPNDEENITIGNVEAGTVLYVSRPQANN